jgi:flagellar biosynthesis protein
MAKKYFQAFALDLPKGPESPPVLSARGEYDLANYIVACARKHGVPVIEKPEMCSALEDVEVDSEIPVELFEAAAAILAEVGALKPRDDAAILESLKQQLPRRAISRPEKHAIHSRSRC